MENLNEITKEQQIKKAEKRAKLKENTKTGLIVFIAFIILIGLMVLAIYVLSIADEDNSSSTNLSDSFVSEVIDGDTFKLENGNVVRLICVDAPELGKTGADEAKDFLEILILNKDVRLVADVDDKDAYGRLLRYVYVNETFKDLSGDWNEEVFVNKELVSNGHASVFRYGNSTRLCGEIES